MLGGVREDQRAVGSYACRLIKPLRFMYQGMFVLLLGPFGLGGYVCMGYVWGCRCCCVGCG